MLSDVTWAKLWRRLNLPHPPHRREQGPALGSAVRLRVPRTPVCGAAPGPVPPKGLGGEEQLCSAAAVGRAFPGLITSLLR